MTPSNACMTLRWCIVCVCVCVVRKCVMTEWLQYAWIKILRYFLNYLRPTRRDLYFVKTSGHKTMRNEEPHVLCVGQRLTSLLTHREMCNSCCLVTVCDFLVGSITVGLHVALCRDISLFFNHKLQNVWIHVVGFLRDFCLVQIVIRLISSLVSLGSIQDMRYLYVTWKYTYFVLINREISWGIISSGI
jgi:hypothetical protein